MQTTIGTEIEKMIYNLLFMIYSELPQPKPTIYKTIQKKHISIITPDKILLNEKLMLGLMFTGIAMIFVSWAFRKNNQKS